MTATVTSPGAPGPRMPPSAPLERATGTPYRQKGESMSLEASVADHPAMPEPLPLRALPDPWPENTLAMLRWMPPYVQFTVVNPWHKRRLWLGYVLALMGTLDTGTEHAPDTPRFFLARDALEGLQPRPAAFLDAPEVRDRTVIPLIAWDRCIWYRQLLPSIEARWRPETGLSIHHRGDFGGISTADLAKFSEGHELLQYIEIRGRPENSYARTEQEV